MCPVCMTTYALIAAGATSVGGAAAVVFMRLYAHTPAKPAGSSKSKGEEDGISTDSVGK